MEFSLEGIVGEVTPLLRSLSSDVQVEFITEVRELLTIAGGTHMYDDPYLLVQLSNGNQGCAWAFPGEIELEHARHVAGANISSIDFSGLPDYLTAALLDAVAPLCWPLPSPSQRVTLSGSGSEKSTERAKCLINQLRLDVNSKIGILGMVEDVVSAVERSSSSMRIADLLVDGTEAGGVKVENDFMDVLDWCDAALITGNVLKTDTLDQVCSVISKRDIHAVAYCMTGHNLLPVLKDQLPFRTITSETFPFYWFAGTDSVINVY